MLLGCDSGQRLEPVREVRGTLFKRPLLHGMGYLVGNVEVKWRSVINDLLKLLIRWPRKALLHIGIGEEQLPPLRGDLI